MRVKKGIAIALAALMTVSWSSAPVRAAERLEVSTEGGSASKPAFNADNFPTLDTDGNKEYYFGKNGNAFYGVPHNGVGFTSNTSWELVDTDSDLGNDKLISTWGSYSGSNLDGQTLLDNTKGLIGSFSIADQQAMKSHSVSCDAYWYGSGHEGTVSGSVSEAKLWPLDAKQLMLKGVTPNDDNCSQVTELEKKLYSNSGYYVWTRSASCGRYDLCCAWCLYSSSLNYYGNYGVASSFRVAPAFNLDLEEVLIARSAESEVSQTPLLTTSEASGDLKFLINAGSEKSSFTAPIAGKRLKDLCVDKEYSFNYSNASTESLNGGTNYVSAIIYDSTGKAVYYGNLGAVSSDSGTANITIPNDLTVGDTYTLALFEEEKCAPKMTDYASDPVYCSFKAIDKYNLSFDATTNGGTTGEKGQSYDPNTKVSLDGKTASREGWEFAGWSESAKGKNRLDSITMTSDKKLYAQFKKDVKASFIDG